MYGAFMPVLDLWFSSGESTLSVRQFTTVERMFDQFEVEILALSPNDDIEFETLVGKPAALYIASGTAYLSKDGRRFAGICSHLEQLRPETKGLSTYKLRIVPSLWQLTQRRNHRTFQHLSVPEIIDELLGQWRIPHQWRVDRARHPKLELRVQYGETDFDFLRRMLEEAGISFYLCDGEGDEGSVVMLHERPDRGESRSG
jgi:type VI secretion system secreted protein VgrG